MSSSPSRPLLAAVAAASRDPILQWYYTQVPDRADSSSNPALELLWYDATLEPTPPDGQLPLGAAFPAHCACISSRSSWDMHDAVVVYGKAGNGREPHGHHDMGQVCISAGACDLITDLGKPAYGPGYFMADRYEYYPAAAAGHNILTIGNRHLRAERDIAAAITHTEFDDRRGSVWQIDSTPLYERSRRIRRTVIHLLPGIVAVLDEAELVGEHDIHLRWHTGAPAEPSAEGAFHVRAQHAGLAAQVVVIDGKPARFCRKQHAYAPPFDKNRYGEPLSQKHESYVEVALRAGRCRLLTVFSVQAPGDMSQWRNQSGKWYIDSPEGPATVALDADTLIVTGPRGTMTCAVNA